jgi:diguanylate cyclase (GGDEF)-like protein/PAS domain S-box-containing protein
MQSHSTPPSARFRKEAGTDGEPAPRLLVVGRGPASAHFVERLTRTGHDVAIASDTASAIQMVKDQDIELVLLEGPGPESTSLDLLKLLRMTYPQEELPIVFVAGDPNSDLIVEALDHGANDYVPGADFPIILARIKSQMALKRAGARLRQLREREALASRLSHDGLWDWDLTSGVVEYSQRWSETLGLSGVPPPSLSTWTDRIHPDDRDRVLGQLANCRQPDGPSELVEEHRLQRADGAYLWILNRAAILRDPSGKPLRIVGAILDITLNKSLDPLTALPNRAAFLESLAQTIRNCADTAHGFAVIVLNLDRFQIVNQTMGQLLGDELLRAVASRLKGVVRTKSARASDLVARIAGDEFGVVLSHIDTEQQARCVAQRILACLHEPFRLGGAALPITATLGVAVTGPGFQDPTFLLRNADTALQRGKMMGRDCYVVFEPSMRDSLEAQMLMENDLRHAIERNQLDVYYQPKVELDSGRLAGFEALVRWNHPTRGLLHPAEFIPLAETTGLIRDIDYWVLETACRQMQLWRVEMPQMAECDLSANLSASHLQQPGLTGTIAGILLRSGFPAGCLHLEITESLGIADLPGASAVLRSLKELGVGLKMDDFGTGYSSLNYLAKLPFDCLKIDRSFVNHMFEEPHALQVITTIIELAKKLHMDVIAEGVESKEQADTLRLLGCRYGQGYYFAVPRPASDAKEILRQRDACPATCLPELSLPAHHCPAKSPTGDPSLPDWQGPARAST